jgi:adenylate cyclase
MLAFKLPAPNRCNNPMRIMSKRTLGWLREYLLPTVLCIGLAFALSTTAWLQRLETVTLDNITRFRVRFQEPPDPRLFTVGIDDDSIEAYGGWPWDRKVHARFLYSVSFGKPSVVAWDILFTEPKESDDFLKDAAAKLGGRVVFGAYTNGDDDPQQPPLIPAANQPLIRIEGDQAAVPTSAFALRPIPALQEVGLSAFCDTPAGDGGVRRHVPMIQRVGNQIYPSLSLQTLMTYGNIKPNDVRIVLGDAIYLEGETLRRRIPIDQGGR